jgi:hypothetical protein
MLLNPKRINSKEGFGSRDLESVDPFDAPVPGQSLTEEPGKRPWDTPPTITDVDDAFEYVIAKIEDNVELADDLDKFLMSGTPVESIVNTIAFTGFAEGMWSPDIAEMLKFPLSAYFAIRAKEQGFKLVMFNREDTPSVTDEQIINNLRENDPEAVELIKEELLGDQPSSPESFLDEEPIIDAEQIITEELPELPEKGMLAIEEGSV